MIALLRIHLRQLVRGGWLLLILALTFLIHWIGLTLVAKFSGYLEWVELVLGISLKQQPLLLTSLYLQLFSGMLLAAVYGIWLVPYLHRGDRGELIASLPLAKWKYPIVYALVMALLLLMIHGVTWACYGQQVGVAAFRVDNAARHILSITLSLETIVFEMVMFFFAFCSLTLGEASTFFIGMAAIVILQAAAILIHLDRMTLGGLVRWGYDRLPPLGELTFDLWKQFNSPQWNDVVWSPWILWLIIFMGLFLYKIQRPSFHKFTDE